MYKYNCQICGTEFSSIYKFSRDEKEYACCIKCFSTKAFSTISRTVSDDNQFFLSLQDKTAEVDLKKTTALAVISGNEKININESTTNSKNNYFGSNFDFDFDLDHISNEELFLVDDDENDYFTEDNFQDNLIERLSHIFASDLFTKLRIANLTRVNNYIKNNEGNFDKNEFVYDIEERIPVIIDSDAKYIEFVKSCKYKATKIEKYSSTDYIFTCFIADNKSFDEQCKPVYFSEENILFEDEFIELVKILLAE